MKRRTLVIIIITIIFSILTHTAIIHSVLVDFGSEGWCSELLAAPEEDDPSIAFSPGSADVAERYVWKRDSETYLHQRRPLCRVSSNQERTTSASMKYSPQKKVDHITQQVRM